jgi:2-oxo-3-hexenedioate decarboxylase
MNSPTPDDIAAIAREAFDLLGSGRQTAPFSERYPGFGLKDAYRVTTAVRQLREARGEVPVGRKIGFTNRTIWAEYGVYAPIWGHVYDRTVRRIADIGGEFSLAGLAEPRIEPEIVLGIGTTPAAGMDEEALLGCIDWVAHGFEIVQSLFPGWRFAAADTVAGHGLHGALLLGPRRPIAQDRQRWREALSRFEIDLLRDGDPVDHGRAGNVLDGPLSALRHFNDLLAGDPGNLALAAGEMVTTGTLTRAFPVAPGETWSTAPSGVPLQGISVRFV